MSELLRTFLENERGIKRFLSRFLRRPQDIDDLTQETFLRAFAAEALRDAAVIVDASRARFCIASQETSH